MSSLNLIDKKLESIAKNRLLIETLDIRQSDSLDCHEVSVVNIKKSLVEAMELGKTLRDDDCMDMTSVIPNSVLAQCNYGLTLLVLTKKNPYGDSDEYNLKVVALDETIHSPEDYDSGCLIQCIHHFSLKREDIQSVLDSIEFSPCPINLLEFLRAKEILPFL